MESPEPKTKHTDKDMLIKGIKTMALCAVLMLVGPTLLYLVLGNPNKPFFWPLVIIGVGVCGFSIYLGFKGLRTIMRSVFG
ncbi:MAG: DUF6095 family protein [Bacteroidota bacterium]